eukprot:764145-Hanusia_phi.AAC.1
MIVLRRSADPCRWYDLQLILGAHAAIRFIQSHDIDPLCKEGSERFSEHLEASAAPVTTWSCPWMDYQTFAGKERLHELKYQAGGLTSRRVLLRGPLRASVHRSTSEKPPQRNCIIGRVVFLQRREVWNFSCIC